ncbi:MAG TPA: peptidoglycan recognition family protein [Nannocystis sp.]
MRGLVVAIAAGVTSLSQETSVSAAPDPTAPALAAPEIEPETDHTRPAWIEDWTLEPPPPLAAEPEYPLAVAFDPACSCNYTPDGMTGYQHVVVHTMQGSYAGTKAWFKNPQAKVSTHYIMRSIDGEVTQMVLDKDKAWHVGSSNAVSLGIEHEGYVDDPNKWYTWETYVSSARLTRWLLIRHGMPIDRDHVVGHVELPNQTHTDPGPGWNWDMYMGLVRDVVPAGEIHAIVVDRAKLCTITALVDTYLQRTAEATELLEGWELCPIAAGTPVTYMHASPPIGTRRRLLMEPGQGPCAGVNGLDAEAFIDEAHFSALCDPQAMAAAGATVRVDGGPPVAVDASGVALLPPVGPGAHVLDVTAPGLYEPATEMVDLAVYPGVRLAIAVDPVPVEPPPPDPTGGETGGGETGDETGEPGGGETGGGGSGASASAGSSGPGDASGGWDPTGEGPDEPTSGGAPGSEGGDEAGGLPDWHKPALPEGYGQHGDEGCGCRSGERGGAWALAGLVLAGLGRRRRR